MAWALLRSRQIFKFGLLRKKDNKKNLKIRLVFNPNGSCVFSALLFLYTTVVHKLIKKITVTFVFLIKTPIGIELRTK
jgi:hypothetical protein